MDEEEKLNDTEAVENIEAEAPAEEKKPSARETFLARMKERAGDVDLESDPEVRYGEFLKYDDEVQGKLKGYKESNDKLSGIYTSNPKFAAFMTTVMEGEDPTVAFVKYFGEDALNASDEESMLLIKKANEEYLNGVAESNKLRETQEENLRISEESMSAFRDKKGMDDESFAKFMDEFYGVVEKALQGNLDEDLLETFYKGLNYDKDLKDAATAGEIEARNKKIEMENRTSKGDDIPNLNNTSKTGTRAPNVERRKSFYAGGPGFGG